MFQVKDSLSQRWDFCSPCASTTAKANCVPYLIHSVWDQSVLRIILFSGFPLISLVWLEKLLQRKKWKLAKGKTINQLKAMNANIKSPPEKFQFFPYLTYSSTSSFISSYFPTFLFYTFYLTNLSKYRWTRTDSIIE